MTRTLDDVKKGLKCCSNDASCTGCPYESDYDCTEKNKDALEYIEQLESAQPKWISVEERLPGYGVGMFFIVCRDDGAVHEARFEISNGRWYELTTEGLWEIDVTHWMPLPEPPEEG